MDIPNETQASIERWRLDTFGDGPTTAGLRRAYEEAKEFVDAYEHLKHHGDPREALDELADLVIVALAHWTSLSLQLAINRKMAINRSREWTLHGDGTGQHKN